MRGSRQPDMKRRGEPRAFDRWKTMTYEEPESLFLSELCSDHVEDIEEPELWGDDSTAIEDWFAAGDELEGVKDWGPWLSEAWEEGVVLRRPKSNRRPGTVRVRR